MNPTNETDLDQLKQSLIEEIEKRMDDHILEPTNAALLRKLILQADNINEALSIAALGTTYKRTGLHFDQRFERMTDSIAYLRRNAALSFHTDDSQPTHKLIIGDNYEALQNLLVSYRGGIDVIYIDPPYGKDSMGEFAQTNYQNAISRDNLLSMLYPRLMLAKQLLSDKGVIFCSIDDKNQAYVKCLFDEVFGESNFVGCITIEGNPRGRQSSKYLAQMHDYLLVYRRSENTILQGFSLNENEIKRRFNKTDENGVAFEEWELRKRGADSRRIDSPNLWFPIYYDEKNKSISTNCKDTNDIVILPKLSSGEDGRWRWSVDKVNKEKGKLYVRKNTKGEWNIYERKYLEEKDLQLAPTIWTYDCVNTELGTKLLKSILGEQVGFSYPKPIGLLSKILQIITTPDATVLDFFAGSGTTGHAVLDLNKQDGGTRTFILCQLNEKTDTTPNGIAYDVTAKRLKRIMTGSCYDGTADFKWVQSNTPYGGNLEVVEIDYVSNFECHEGKSPFEVIDETLYGQPKFATLREKIEWVCTHFAQTQKQVETDQEWKQRTHNQDATRD